MNIFDVIGPIMIGPSSSHTAGAVRMGRVAWKILGEDAIRADIGLAGSFAMTYKGHGTDKALVAGILGMKPDDERIPNSLDLAKEVGLAYTFSHVKIPGAHPNTAVINLTGKDGATCTVEGVSIGGGNIQITKLNGMAAAFNGTLDTLIIAHHDRPGAIAAVTDKLAQFGINIGSFRLSRPKKNELAIMTIELDSSVDKDVVNELRGLDNIVSVVYMHPAS
ncbi:MAG: L-serine ammonia-lyase, iron-sulfur-dependent subunit beta [Defluviitaleaceae bacterium]|nr:L-serine ammonia-lyase, iron-sulfur-dependent subunit beta [Defluviitaleaceae bacterium]